MFYWFTYRVHERRKSYQIQEFSHLSDERILCIGSSQKQPVLKWDNIMAWPGKLTLTDKAIYFEVFHHFMTTFLGSLHHWIRWWNTLKQTTCPIEIYTNKTFYNLNYLTFFFFFWCLEKHYVTFSYTPIC